MHWSCIAHAHLMHPHSHIFATLAMPWSISCFHFLSMSCFSLFFVVFFKDILSFIWASFSHSSCIPYASYPCSYLLFFISFFLTPLSIRVKKGESILEIILENFVISIWLLCTFSGGEILFLVHILKGRNPLGKCMYQGREGFSYKKTLFCLFYIMCFLVFLYCALSYI